MPMRALYLLRAASIHFQKILAAVMVQRGMHPHTHTKMRGIWAKAKKKTKKNKPKRKKIYLCMCNVYKEKYVAAAIKRTNVPIWWHHHRITDRTHICKWRSFIYTTKVYLIHYMLVSKVNEKREEVTKKKNRWKILYTVHFWKFKREARNCRIVVRHLLRRVALSFRLARSLCVFQLL